MILWDNTGVTVELGRLIEQGVELWDFDYPVPRSQIEYNGKVCTVDFDKERLQHKIVDRYYFRQIGQETTGRFLHYFRARMCEIMPYYVQLYEFDAKFRNIDDPLESYNLREQFTQTTAELGRVTGTHSSETLGASDRNTNSTRTGTADKLTKFSDTPQGSVENLDTYLTNATQENGDTSETERASETASDETNTTGESSQTSENDGTVSHTLERRGNIGVQPLGGEVINIRSAFINIDEMIVDELNNLFLQVY